MLYVFENFSNLLGHFFVFFPPFCVPEFHGPKLPPVVYSGWKFWRKESLDFGVGSRAVSFHGILVVS